MKRFVFLSLTCSTLVMGAAVRSETGIIIGCFDPPARIDSGKLHLTTFKDVLLLGDAARGPRYVAIVHAMEGGAYEFWLFDSVKVEERYRILPKRNEIRVSDAGSIVFTVCRRTLAEGVQWKACGEIMLTPTAGGDLKVVAQIEAESESLLFFSRKERTHVSFELRRLKDRNIESLTVGNKVSDLPGPVEERRP